MTGETRKIVMLTPNFHPYIGGAEKQALELSLALAARGARVWILTRRLGGLPAEDSLDGLTIRRSAAWGPGLANPIVFMLSSLWTLLRRRKEYDVIHVHLGGSPALAAALAGRLLSKAVVVKIGGGRGIGEIAVSSRTLAGRLKLKLLKSLRPQLVAVTRDLAAEMDEHGLGDGVRVIANGVDTEHYRPMPPEQRRALRAELGWPAAPIFLFVGRLAIEKRLVAFLQAFARIAGASSAHCVLVGSGPEEENIRFAIGRLGLAARVDIMPPTRDIARLYAAADTLILPSVSEGLSNSLLEAMAAGIPVLGSRVGGTREAVEDGETGILFDPSDDEALLRGLRRLLDEPDLGARLGQAARARAIARYAITAVAESYLNLYNELCSAL